MTTNNENEKKTLTNVPIKCVIVGDGAVGKTCLLWVYAKDEFPEDYVPTIFDNYTANVDSADFHIKLGLYDTAGQEEYDKLRLLSYPGTSIFLICFSLISAKTLDNIKEKWFPEVQKNSKGTPILLVGTKSDLKNDQATIENLQKKGEKIVTEEEAKKFAKDIGAEMFLECSAKTKTGVKQIFDEAIRIVLLKNENKNNENKNNGEPVKTEVKEPKKKSGCNIL
eukprot:EC826328.1.p1 GENE.EC826328.1~~EC826328.1.p1  ORF type:complete len:224 (+),score=112.68 EC826328.1:31-702(+)